VVALSKGGTVHQGNHLRPRSPHRPWHLADVDADPLMSGFSDCDSAIMVSTFK